MRRQVIALLIASLGCVLLVAPAWGHHSHVMYEPVKLVAFEGIVTEAKWRNPHMLVAVDVPNEQGVIENWLFEGNGAAATISAGISVDMLKPGKKVKIIAHPAKDATRHEALLMGVEHNGKFYARGAGSNIRGTEEEKEK